MGYSCWVLAPAPRTVSSSSLAPDGPRAPAARGPLTEALLSHLRGPARAVRLPPVDGDPLTGEDFQLALYTCYELHYQGFAGVDERWEWEPSLLAWRAALEDAFETALRDAVGPLPAGDIVDELGAVADAPGPSLSSYMEIDGTWEQLREFVIHRSLYQLKEADPHTWAIPRLTGAPKAAIIDLQMDEYGRGVEQDMHSSLFAETMTELGLDPTYGRYLDVVPGTTLATTNIITMFGLHRRLRGALVGHLALFEMTSVTPMGRYSRALSRFGASAGARRFYDVHVEADAVHQVVAARQLVEPLVAAEPHLGPEVAFGARAASLVEGSFSSAMFDAWRAGRSSLRSELELR